jgi:hypothetical protein
MEKMRLNYKILPIIIKFEKEISCKQVLRNSKCIVWSHFFWWGYKYESMPTIWDTLVPTPSPPTTALVPIFSPNVMVLILCFVYCICMSLNTSTSNCTSSSMYQYVYVFVHIHIWECAQPNPFTINLITWHRFNKIFTILIY